MAKKVYKFAYQSSNHLPNRLDGNGCSFCSEVGTGFEALASQVSVTEQLERTK